MRNGNWETASAKERHRPPHRLEGEALFITAATHQRRKLLSTGERRTYFRDLLFSAATAHQVEIVVWVILAEHYHIVVRPASPEAFQRWNGQVHEDSASAWNAEDGLPGRQVWYQFWDRSLWTEGDLWSRINYIHANPVKHGYVTEPSDWAWSSYAETAYWHEPERAELRSCFPAPLKVPDDDF